MSLPQRSLLALLAPLALVLSLGCHRKTTTSATPPSEPSEWVDQKPLIGEPDTTGPLEYGIMDPVDISPLSTQNPDSLTPYQASHTFQHDLLHTKIEIAFDWAQKRANGKATLTLKPWFYTTDQLTLDAKNFDIKSVTLTPSNQTLKYEYNNEQLQIQLDRPYSRSESFSVHIQYTAKPDERSSFGGSAAITNDKGLYFINPDGKEAGKPRQIWTQGETESNSFWFPTIDKPNERCTQEMYITVAEQYKTLSNGVLVSSVKNNDGTRTDYWKMDKPHAPYLFMMAIGEFAVVKDKWRDKEVSYYVEPAFEPYARDIYPYTTEMLEFFSNKLGYDYPWSKYAQVVVRDYVSGAMENTTAVIFGEFMQKTKRELLDDHLTNEKVVAHEMFHHWFGDLVTTESWANLTMNEGFANYSEYLWLEHKYGKDAADAHLQQEQQGYMYSAADGGHPLIHFGYENREDMFDAHSYNKGGCVLHMLRHYVGDEAFFAALRKYLQRNEYTDVEAHELRLAFEDVTGQDLNWFFNQWYFGAGHPSLDISYQWNADQKQMEVTIAQQQLAENGVAHVFRLPLAMDIYGADGKVTRQRVEVTKRQQTFYFPCPEQPRLVNVDADKALLCVKTDRHTPEEWAFLYENGPLYRDRIEALSALSPDDPDAQTIYTKALADKSPAIRELALRSVAQDTPGAVDAVARLAATDPEPSVRAMAINLLGQTGDAQFIPVIAKAFEGEQAYSVVGAALSALAAIDPAAAINASKSLENDSNMAVVTGLAALYAQNPAPDRLPWFRKYLSKVDQMAAFEFFDQFQVYITGLNDAAALEEALRTWQQIALTPAGNSEWRRFAATKSLADTRNYFSDKGVQEKATAINAIINEIKEKETDETLKLYYGMF